MADNGARGPSPDGSYDISDGTTTGVVVASAAGGARVVVAGPGTGGSGGATEEDLAIPPGLQGFFKNVLEITNHKFIKTVLENLEKLGVETPSDFKVSATARSHPLDSTRPDHPQP